MKINLYPFTRSCISVRASLAHIGSRSQYVVRIKGCVTACCMRWPIRSVTKPFCFFQSALHETVIIIIALAVAAVAVAAIVAFMKLRAGGGCGKSGKAPVGHQVS